MDSDKTMFYYSSGINLVIHAKKMASFLLILRS